MGCSVTISMCKVADFFTEGNVTRIAVIAVLLDGPSGYLDTFARIAQRLCDKLAVAVEQMQQV